MFGRATIRLGIGPHSSCVMFYFPYQAKRLVGERLHNDLLYVE